MCDKTIVKNLYAAEDKKQILEKLLSTKSKRLTVRPNNKGKNKTVWSQFDIAYLDGVEQQYACCKRCKCFVKYSGRTGTGGLMRHNCYKLFSPPDQKKITLRLHVERLIHQGSSRIGFVPNYKGKSGVWSQFQMITLDNEIVNFARCLACRNIVSYISRRGTGSLTRHKCQKNNFFKNYYQNREAGERENLIGESIRNVTILNQFLNLPENEESNEWRKKKIKQEIEDPNKEAVENYSNDRQSWQTKDGWHFTEAQDLRPRKQTEFHCQKNSKIAAKEVSEAERIVQEKRYMLLKKFLAFLNVFQNEEFLDFAQSLIDLGAKCGKVDAREIFQKNLDFIKVVEKFGYN